MLLTRDTVETLLALFRSFGYLAGTHLTVKLQPGPDCALRKVITQSRHVTTTSTTSKQSVQKACHQGSEFTSLGPHTSSLRFAFSWSQTRHKLADVEIVALAEKMGSRIRGPDLKAFIQKSTSVSWPGGKLPTDPRASSSTVVK